MKRIIKQLVLFFTSLFFIQVLNAQVIPFDSDKWHIDAQAKVIEGYQGQKSLYLQRGHAYLKDVELEDGIIEFDMYMQEKRSFSGVIFRMQDDNNYEEIYFRPHHSTHPDAFQYTPIFNGLAAWQLYHDQYGLVNSTGTIDHYLKDGNIGYNGMATYSYDKWMHFKIVINGDEAEVFFENGEKPILHIYDLKREKAAGKFGLTSGAGGMHFANFSYQKVASPKLVITEKRSVKDVPNAIKDYEISEGFDYKTITIGAALDQKQLKKNKWQKVSTANDGLLNIAKHVAISREKNTVYLKYSINADKAKIQMLTFGYSDEVLIYHNGQPLYAGQNRFLSRDYRYLGTIGYFDNIFLSLKKGNNEIIIAVKENFGGWGFQAKLEN